MSKENDEIISNLRACVLSCKGGVTLKVLNKDYKDLVGTSVPYTKFGHKTLEAFLASLKDFRIVKNSMGESVLQVIPNDSTAHLAKLISHQKSKAKSNSQGNYYTNRSNNNRRRPFQTASQNKYSQQRPYNSTHWYAQSRSAPHGIVQRSNIYQANKQKVNLPQKPVASSHRPSSVTSELKNDIQKHLAGNASSARWVKPPTAPAVQEAHQARPVPLPPPLSRAAPLESLTVNVKFPPAPNTNTQSGQFKSSPASPPSTRVVTLRNSQQRKSHIQNLTTYAEENCLGIPILRTVAISTNNKMKFVCRVEVGTLKACDPSARENTPEEARQKAAKMMLDKLQSLKLGGHPTTAAVPTTTNKKITAMRIHELMQEHPHGLWASEIPTEYRKRYSESLQGDWLSFVDDNDEYELIKWNSNKIIVQLALVLNPPVLEPPNTEYWDIHITSVVSSTEVWVRVLGVGYSDELFHLTEEMNTAREKLKFGLKKIHSGKFVLALLSETIHRAEVLRCEEGSDTAICRLPDLGLLVQIPLKNMACLPEKFSKLPFQAFKCSLKGVEVFKSEDVSNLLEEELLDRVLIARCIEETSDEDLRVIELFDTSTAEDINVNEQLTKTIISRMHSPSLPQGMHVTQVRVSHVSDAGDVYVHPYPAIVRWLESQLLELMPALAAQQPLTFVDTSDMYVASCPELAAFGHTDSPDSSPGGASRIKLGRVQLETSTSTSKLAMLKIMEVFFIDYGIPAKVEISALRRLPTSSKELANVPPQVVRCKLRGVPPQLGMVVGDRTVKRMRELVPPGRRVALRTSRPGTSYEPPQVELFSRTQPDNLVCSINDTVAMDATLFERGPLFPVVKQMLGSY